MLKIKSHQELVVDFSMKSYPLSMKHKRKEQSVSVFIEKTIKKYSLIFGKILLVL